MYGPIYDISKPISNASNNSGNQGALTWNSNNPLQYFASDNDQITLGSLRSSSLEALLRIYEVTCDMKYLHEFMEQSTIICNMRADKVGQSSSWKYWFIKNVYFHGRILHPLTHFVYLVKSNNALYHSTIPYIHRSNFGNKSTYGEYADWLNINDIEVTDFLLQRYWFGGDECMCKPSSISQNNCIGESKSIMEMNMQAPFGCALTYLFLSNNNRIDYGVKTVEMARAYLITHGNVLKYIPPYNAYNWYHTGWNKNSNGSLVNHHFEDIGHGAFDIMFPILYNKYYNHFYPYITGGQYFENYQLVRFRNTFTKSIYNPNYNSNCSSLQSTFNCNVMGVCFGHYYGENIEVPSTNEFSKYQMNAKNWAGLYVYDNVPGAASGPSVYSILMNYYISVESCLPIISNNYGGVSIVGLADLVVANYKKEGISCDIPVQPNPPNSISVYPNPSKDNITIETDEDIKFVSITTLFGQTILIENNRKSINLDGVSNGVYLLKVRLENGEEVIRKIQIEK